MLLTLLPICSIDAAELNVLAGGAMRAALQELIPPFEHSSGHSVRIEYGTVAKVAERVSAGDPVDVAVLTKPPLDKLIDNAGSQPARQFRWREFQSDWRYQPAFHGRMSAR